MALKLGCGGPLGRDGGIGKTQEKMREEQQTASGQFEGNKTKQKNYLELSRSMTWRRQERQMKLDQIVPPRQWPEPALVSGL